MHASTCLAALLVVASLVAPTVTADEGEVETAFSQSVRCQADIEADGSGVCREGFWINSSNVDRSSPSLHVHDEDILNLFGGGIADNATLTWVDADGAVVYKVDCRNLIGVDLFFTQAAARPPTNEETPEPAPGINELPVTSPVRCVVLRDAGTYAPGLQTLRINAFADPGSIDGVSGGFDYEPW